MKAERFLQQGILNNKSALWENQQYLFPIEMKKLQTNSMNPEMQLAYLLWYNISHGVSHKACCS